MAEYCSIYINNAFYAVTEKKKQQPEGYEPTVFVSTKMIGDKVEIRVKDNGNGIPQKVLDKIFQPFFTTKPTGQGTGLGLSLAYDIVKAHGGELKGGNESYLAEAAEADDESGPRQPVGDVDAVERRRRRRQQPLQDDRRQRRQCHGQNDGGRQQRRRLRVEQSHPPRRRVDDESELAALRQQQRQPERIRMADAEHPRHAVDAGDLDRHEHSHRAKDQRPVAGDERQVDRHADAEEEEAKQQAAERLNVGFELMAEGRFGEDHAGDERAHRHRQPACLHGQRRAEHDEQRRRGLDFPCPRVGEYAEEWVQQIASDGDHANNRRHRNGNRRQVRAGVCLDRRQHCDDRQQRHDGEVLEQQDRERLLPVRLGGLAPLLQNLHHDRR